MDPQAVPATGLSNSHPLKNAPAIIDAVRQEQRSRQMPAHSLKSKDLHITGLLVAPRGVEPLFYG